MTDLPKPTGGDAAHLVARSLIGSIPIVGAAGMELFNAVIVPPLSRRRDEWLSSLAEQFARLEKTVDGFKVENLKDDEVFITAVLHAMTAALRTHQREKLDALRNAVLNVALRTSPDEDVQLMFLGFIDKFTPWHLRVLTYFNMCPTNFEPAHKTGKLFEIFPDLRGQEALFEQIVRDLHTNGLVLSNTTPGTATAFMPYTGRTTEMGERFLEFITSPLS